MRFLMNNHNIFVEKREKYLSMQLTWSSDAIRQDYSGVPTEYILVQN